MGCVVLCCKGCCDSVFVVYFFELLLFVFVVVLLCVRCGLCCGGVLVEHYSLYAVSAVFCFVYVVVVNVVVC